MSNSHNFEQPSDNIPRAEHPAKLYISWHNSPVKPHVDGDPTSRDEYAKACALGFPLRRDVPLHEPHIPWIRGALRDMSRLGL
jgi:hypothetical protein